MLTQERKKNSFLGSNKNKTKLKIHTANIPSEIPKTMIIMKMNKQKDIKRKR